MRLKCLLKHFKALEETLCYEKPVVMIKMFIIINLAHNYVNFSNEMDQFY